MTDIDPDDVHDPECRCSTCLDDESSMYEVSKSVCPPVLPLSVTNSPSSVP